MTSEERLVRRAHEILGARRDGVLLAAPGDLVGDEPYAVQRLVTRARLDDGERPTGWKVGYASDAMRRQMGIAAPNLGPLTDAMTVPSGATLAAGLRQPRVEPEVALVVLDAPPPGADRTTVRACVARACAALEVVDSVWLDYRFAWGDNTADGSSAAYAVLGPDLPLDDLDALDVELDVAGGTARGRSSDAMGHPLDSLAWLAAELVRLGARLQPGDVVLTGGLTRALDWPAGTRAEAVFTHHGDEVARVDAHRAAALPAEHPTSVPSEEAP